MSEDENDDFDWETDDEPEILNVPRISSSSLAIPNGEASPATKKDTVISGDESDNFNWDTDDELEILNVPGPSTSNLAMTNGERIPTTEKASSSMDSSRSSLMDHFVGMGFAEKLVAKAMKENGEDNADLILNCILTYSALEDSPQHEQCPNSDPSPSDQCLSDNDESFVNDFSDMDSCSDSGTESLDVLPNEKTTLISLTKMGYTRQEAAIAVDRCGPIASIAELTDFLCAAQMARAADALMGELPDDIKPKLENGSHKKRRFHDCEVLKRKKQKGCDGFLSEDMETLRLPNPMIGFGVPSEPDQQIDRVLPEAAIGPPFFYYENVALTPKGVWDTISRFLYDIEPEFVDSKYFCAAARKRGYIHNLPIHSRFPLVPLQPRTIHDALPLTRKWWPSWDMRTNLNCLQTCTASARLTERIRKALESCDGDPPLPVQKKILDECRKWNLVWVGRNKAAPLEPDEVEVLLGFPRNHTRGGGSSRTERFKSLGNSFQVDTVAYHLSVLKDMYPEGINLLSLFSGIGGAEVALHRLGIRMKNVVSVEKSEVNRNVVRSWWDQTNQKGNLIDFDDVQELNGDKIENLINTFGGFDLVIGGSPCNNLTGSNRHSRDGLEGRDSVLFYDYFRILDIVKSIMSRQH